MFCFILKKLFLYLTEQAELSNCKPLKGHKALFLSIHGGGQPKDPVSGVLVELGIMLSYIIPLKHSGKLVTTMFTISFACLFVLSQVLFFNF